MGKYLPRPLSNPIGPRPRGLQQTLQMQYPANNMARAVALLSAMPSRQQATDLTLPSAASKFLTGVHTLRREQEVRGNHHAAIAKAHHRRPSSRAV
jgi:hypothetical protein